MKINQNFLLEKLENIRYFKKHLSINFKIIIKLSKTEEFESLTEHLKVNFVKAEVKAEE